MAGRDHREGGIIGTSQLIGWRTALDRRTRQPANQLDARVASEGEGEGIAFAFDRMERTPNTRAAHQLIELAQSQGRGQGVVDALFHAYF